MGELEILVLGSLLTTSEHQKWPVMNHASTVGSLFLLDHLDSDKDTNERHYSHDRY